MDKDKDEAELSKQINKVQHQKPDYHSPTITNKIDAIVVMVNQLCDNILISDRDVATHMVAIQAEIRFDQVEPTLQKRDFDLEKLNLFVLDNGSNPYCFVKVKTYESKVFDKLDGSSPHLFKVISDEMNQGKQGPWVIAMNRYTNRSNALKVTSFAVIK